jgi:hypothetical protein
VIASSRGGDSPCLQHHPEVIPDDPVFSDAVIADAIDVDMLDREPLPPRTRNASKDLSFVGATPPVVADDKALVRE